MLTQTSKLNKFFFIIILGVFLFYFKTGTLPELYAENKYSDVLPEHSKKQLLTVDKKKDQNKEETMYELSQDQFGQPIDTQKYKPQLIEQTQKNKQIDQEQQTKIVKKINQIEEINRIEQIKPVEETFHIKKNNNKKLAVKEVSQPDEKGKIESETNPVTNPVNKQSIDLNNDQAIKKEKSTTIYNPNISLKHDIKNFSSPSLLKVLLNFLLKLSTVILSCLALLLSYMALKTAKRAEAKVKNELKIEM